MPASKDISFEAATITVNKEYEAYELIDQRLQAATGKGLNELAEVTAAVILWGERLAAIRTTQTPTQQHSALTHALDNEKRFGGSS